MNRITTLGLLLLACLATNSLFSQCIPNPAPQPGPTCGSAPFLCCGEINNLAGGLQTINNPAGPNPLCGNGGTPHNTEWVAFAAGSTNLTLNIALSNCNDVMVGGNTFSGVQVGIYGDCAFTDEIVCLGDCQTNNFSISTGGLNIGQVYYLFFDGCAGSICDYQISVPPGGGSTEAPMPGNVSNISGPGINGTPLCEGSTPSYSANALFTTAYNWTVSGGSGGANFIDNGLSIDIADWGGPGTYTICATPFNDCHPPSSLNEFCTTVTVDPNIPVQLADGAYCEDEPGYVVNINGTNYGPFTEGPQTVTLEDPTEANCDEVYNFNVIQNFNTGGFYSDFVCQGDNYFFPGNGQLYLPGTTSDIPIGLNAAGCDSTITLMLDQIITQTSISGSDLVYDCDDSVLSLIAVTPQSSSVSSYQWSTTDGSIFGGDTGPNILVDGPGTYELIVTYNFFQCTSFPATITIDPGTTGGTTVTGSSTSASCSTGTNGSAMVTPDIAGTYDYQWDAATGNQNTPTAVGLAPGTYYVTVVESGGGCETVDSVVVTATPDVGLAITAENDAGCLGEATGDATVMGSGGTGTLNYLWEPAAGGGSDPSVTSLAANTYAVTVTDDLGCSAETTVTIGEPATAVSVVLDGIDDASCNTSDGNINVTVSGGSGGYVYSWSDSSAGEDLLGVPSGQYILNVTDVNGCPATITETVPSANGPSVSIAATAASCFGATDGSLDMTITGGAAPVVIDWDLAPDIEDPASLPAGTYVVTLLDDNNCETMGSATITEPTVLAATIVATPTDCDTPTGELLVNPTGGNGGFGFDWDLAPDVQNPTGLGADTYTVIVTDSEGCSVTVSETIDLPVSPTGSSSSTNVSCNNAADGVVTITMDGSAVGPFEYDWGNALYDNNATNGSLPPATYNVIVTDGNGCTADFSEIVTENAQISASVAPSAPDCVGDSNGDATVTPAGGTGSGFTYLWCNGETTETVNNLPSGPCTVTVYNDGCEETFNFDVPAAIEVQASLTTSTDITCFGYDDGIIEVNGSGGTGTLEYQWGGGLPDSPNLTDLEPGIYELTLEDANGCSVILDAVTIAQPDLLELDVQATPTDCDVDNGSLLVLATGGNGGYGYDWDNAPDTDNPSNLGDATYNVIVTDALGCSETGQAIITQPASSTGSSTYDDVSCNAADDGEVNILMDAGGNGPYDYDWGNATLDGNSSNDNLPPDTYNVIVTDDNGCTTVFSEVVAEPDPILATVNPAAPNCFGELNGSALVIPSGGTGSDYTFEWCNSETTASITNLPAGNCTVIVYNDGCQQDFNFTVPDVVELTAANVSYDDASCNAADDGSIVVTAAGGTGTIYYDWGPGIADDPNPTGLAPGIYQVTVEDDNGCSEILDAVTIIEPDPMVIASTTMDATCNQNNGTISLTVTGGDGDYTYNWPAGYPDSPLLDEIVPAGTIPVTVVDGEGCDVSEMIEVMTPNPLVVDAISATEVSCFNDMDASAVVEVSGGNGPYTFDWGPGFAPDSLLTGLPSGTYNVAISDVDDCIVNSSVVIANPADIAIVLEGTQATDCLMPTGSIDVSATGGTGSLSFLWNGTTATEDLSMLAPGSYSLVVTDDKMCTAELTVPISAPGIFTATEAVTNSTCSGADNGIIDIEVTDGSGNFTYTWPTSSGVGNVDMAGGLSPGNYAILIADDDTGCEYTVNTAITEPALLEITAGSDTDASCLENDGSIFIDVEGGSGGNMYVWSGPSSYTSNDEDISNLVPGNYDLIITDMNGCTTTTSANIGVPDDPTLTADEEDARCAGEANGNIQLSLTDPNGGATFTWSDGTIGDTDFADNLMAGTYDVTVTDALDCTAEITGMEISEPAPIVLSFTEMQASCGQNNGSVEVTVVGGVGPYDYDWSDLQDGIPNPGMAGAGIHTVTVTDANLCEQMLDAIVTEPSSLASAVAVVDVDCFQGNTGSIDLTITGGNPGPTGFTYQWTGTTQMVEDPINLPAGTYSVLVTDQDDCSISEVAIEISEGAQIVIDSTIIDATCGDENGSIALTSAGGTGVINYDWDLDQFDNSALADNLGVGNYSVTAVDALGCMEEATYTVLSPGTPEVDSTIIDNECFGGSNGSITLSIITGTPPFDYDWELDQFDDNQTADNLAMGTYNVTVTDANDCPFPMNIPVGEPSQVVASTAMPSMVSCAGETDGGATVEVIGGTPGYTYMWSNGDMDNELSNVAGGSYTVTVFDANMCPAESEVTIDEPVEVTTTEDFTELVSCNGSADGAILVEAAGGDGVFDYTWNVPALNGNNNPEGLGVGNYMVTVSDGAGCTEVLSFDIGEPAGLDIAVDGISDFDGFNVSCATEADGFIDLAVSGGTSGYTYDWSNGETSASLTSLAAGAYLVTITDGAGCIENWDVSLIGPEPITFEFDVLDARCSEDASGAVIITETSGGSGNLIFGLDTDPVGDGIFSNLGAGDYALIAEDDNGCLSEIYDVTVADPSPFEVEIVNEFGVVLEGEQELNYGDSLEISSEIFSGDANFALVEWSQNGDYLCLDAECTSIRIQPTETTTYTVTTVDENGCTAEDMIVVRVRKQRNIYIPNAFNPNSDLNPTFEIGLGAGVESIESFIIVDRWGEIVWQLAEPHDASLPLFGWDGILDGKPMNPGVYVYHIEAKFIDGDVLPFSGDVTLIK